MRKKAFAVAGTLPNSCFYEVFGSDHLTSVVENILMRFNFNDFRAFCYLNYILHVFEYYL